MFVIQQLIELFRCYLKYFSILNYILLQVAKFFRYDTFDICEMKLNLNIKNSYISNNIFDGKCMYCISKTNCVLSFLVAD